MNVEIKVGDLVLWANSAKGNPEKSIVLHQKGTKSTIAEVFDGGSGARREIAEVKDGKRKRPYGFYIRTVNTENLYLLDKGYLQELNVDPESLVELYKEAML